jgi:DNA invertase Pin-like site-specific DNA recombinase
MTKAIIYLRVSTDEQGDSGLGLEAQERECRLAAASKGLEVVEVVREVASGKNLSGRPLLQATLEQLRSNEVDVLLAAKLDRVSRDTLDLLSLVKRSEFEGWALVILDCDTDTRTSAGRLQASIMASFAEFERRRIGERTKAAMSVAKSRGVHCGRRSLASTELISEIVAKRGAGLTLRAIASELSSEGVATLGGAQAWSAESVRLLLKRAA